VKNKKQLSDLQIKKKIGNEYLDAIRRLNHMGISNTSAYADYLFMCISGGLILKRFGFEKFAQIVEEIINIDGIKNGK
jgi:hypothetical protein